MLQQNKPIIECIREYLKDCPLLEGKTIHIDSTGSSTDEYSLKSLRRELVYKKYTDGTVLKQFPFLLTSKGQISMTRDGVSENGFYQKLEEWIASNNADDIYPVLENHVPVRVDVITNGHLQAADAEPPEYQMECRLIYY